MTYNYELMINLLLAFSGIGFFLLLGELLWRKKILKGEYARKFVHITSATFVAFWPIFLTRFEIIMMSLAFIAVLVISKKFHLFMSIRTVKRATYGEIWYALGIAFSALIFTRPEVFSLAILTMALADGLAAITGISLNKKAGQFMINGHRKSFAGTLMFVAVSFGLNFAYYKFFGYSDLPAILNNSFFIAMLAFGNASILAIAELVSPKGSDNVIVPLLAGILVIWPTLI